MSNTQPQSALKRRAYRNPDCYEKLKELYLDTQTADVRFSFGPTREDDTGTQVAAHKSLLAATSDVFKAMFYGTMKETGNIHVPDTSEGAFIEFLQYFYMGKVELSAEHVEEVLYLGQKYNVEKCVSDCFRYLIKLLDDENVCNQFHLAIVYEHPKLMKACEKHILFNTAAVFKSDGFLECDRRVLEHILTKGLTLCPESMVFEAVMSWVKAKCKQEVLSKELVETHLGDLLYEIRFATIKIEEFCALAKQYDSVLSNHHATIINMIVLKEGSDRFKTSPRNFEWNLSATLKCERISKTSKSSFMLELNDETRFSTNKPLFLEGFKCSRIYVGKQRQALKSDLVVDVKIYEHRDMKFKDDNGKLLLEMKANLKSKSVQVSMPQPVIVKPEFYYVIRFGPFPREHYYYSHHSLYQVKMGLSARINFYDHDDNDDDDDGDESCFDSDCDNNSDTGSDSNSDSIDDNELMDQGAFIQELEFKQILI